MHLLNAAIYSGINKFIYLSAICVQKPKLNFQFAKLAFETNLKKSNINHVIIRPTAFFKSLSGQLNRIKQNKKFIKFQDFQLPDQLRTLKLFFQSKDSQNLLKNFKTIDLRHKDKLAIGYY